MTGNHWLAIPCIHPDDGSVHLVGVIHRGARGSVEFAGSAEHAAAAGPPFLSATIEIDGKRIRLAENGIAWERIANWVPTFVSSVESVAIRGAVFAPHGKDVDIPGMVYVVSFENRSAAERSLRLTFEGSLGHRQLRIRSDRSFADANLAIPRDGGNLILEGAALPGLASVAVACDGEGDPAVRDEGGAKSFEYVREQKLPPGGQASIALYLAVGAERDGAEATLEVLRRKGSRDLLSATVRSLVSMSQGETEAGVGRLIDRNLLFAYFFGVARAIDDAQFYMVRTRAPWHARGVTFRDWEALVWLLPAVQLADPVLARELILRACELHGYAPGHGLRYLDGAIFEPGFSLEGASSYAIAIDRYVRETGDDQIVDEPVLADTLYLSHDEIVRRRDSRFPLFSTEVHPDGAAASMHYTLHGNAVVAEALEVFARTLDEETAREVESADAVRAALRRHFGMSVGGQTLLAAATDLAGQFSSEDIAAASVNWLPMFNAMDREDSAFRRSVRAIASSPSLDHWCARLFGPAPQEAVEFLRNAPLYEGIACQTVDGEGRAASGAADATLAGLLAWSLWHAIHALGVKL